MDAERGRKENRSFQKQCEMKYAYTLTLQNRRIIVRVKSNKDFDLSVLSTVDSSHPLFMEAVRQSPEHQMIEYETGDLLSLTDFFDQIHLSKVQACCFLHDLVRAIGTALKNQPVLLDLDAILVSSRADQIYLLRAPLSFDCWMKREQDVDEFWQDLLEYLPCDNYEISGLLWKARKEKRAMEEIYHDLEELYQISAKKKLFAKRHQVPTFQLPKPLVKQVSAESRIIDHQPSASQQKPLVQPAVAGLDSSLTNQNQHQRLYETNPVSFMEKGPFDFGYEHESARSPRSSFVGYDPTSMAKSPAVSLIRDQGRADLQDLHFDFPNASSNTETLNFGQAFDSRNIGQINPYEVASDQIGQKQRSDIKTQTDSLYKEPSYLNPQNIQQQNGYGYVLNDQFAQQNSSYYAAPNQGNSKNQTHMYSPHPLETNQNENPTQAQRRNQTMQANPNIMPNHSRSFVRHNFDPYANQRYSEYDQSDDWQQWQYYENVASNYYGQQEQPGFFAQPDYEQTDSDMNLQDVALKRPNPSENRQVNTRAASNPQQTRYSYIQDQTEPSQITDQQAIPYSFIHEPTSDYQVTETLPPKQNECAHIDWNNKTFYLKGTLCMAGRSEQCQVHIPDDSLSLQHARLSSDQGRWYIQDMKSCNGTWLNGKRIVRKMRLREGMMIRFGNCEAIFHDAPIVKC